MSLFKRKDQKKKVLVVEDDALLAQVLMDKFEAEDFLAKNVADGSQVQSVVAAFQPSIILLDLVLPGLDGFGVLKLLKADSATKNIPVIVISNLGEESDVRSAKALGAKDYFIKANISMEQLFKSVKNLLS